MPDISMCLNKSCGHNITCYRFIAEPNEWRQAYADFKPDAKTGKCDNYAKASDNEVMQYKNRIVREKT